MALTYPLESVFLEGLVERVESAIIEIVFVFVLSAMRVVMMVSRWCACVCRDSEYDVCLGALLRGYMSISNTF